MALQKFKSEAEFRDSWIKPFLAKLGYTLVTVVHGRNEQGKDLFFADFDRFEHVRFCCVQAKNTDIKVGRQLGDLLDQVKRSFEVQIRDYKSAEQMRISAVYVMTSGKITDEARQHITSHCRGVPYGENVYFLDGSRLELLERFCGHVDDRSALRKAVSVKTEARLNLILCQSIRRCCAKQGQPMIFISLRRSALDAYWIDSSDLDLGLITAVMHAQTRCDSLMTAIGVWNSQADAVASNQMLELVEKAENELKQVVEMADTAIKRLKAKWRLKVKIEDRGRRRKAARPKSRKPRRGGEGT